MQISNPSVCPVIDKKAQETPTTASNPVARARGRVRHEPGKLNKTEQKYFDEVLTPLWKSGEYQRIDFEAVKFKVAAKCFYSPDFYVVTSDGFIELHEVKGFMEGDAAVKLRAFHQAYPEYRVLIVKWKNKTVGWETKEVGKDW